MKSDPKLFARLLPALQYMARFPTAKLDVVAQRYGWNAAEVRTVIEGLAGGLHNWDEEYLELSAQKFGVTVPPYSPPAFASREAEARPAVRRMPRIAKAAPAPEPAAVAKDPSPARASAHGATWPWERVLKPQKKTVLRYWPILSEIVARPDVPQSTIAAKHGVKAGTFSAFRQSWLIGVEINAATLGELRRWAVSRWDGVMKFSEPAPAPAKVEDAPVADAPPPETRIAVAEPAPTAGALDDTLEELTAIAVAYTKNRRRGWPHATLRRTLIGVCSEVVELAVPGGVAAVAEGTR